MRSRLISPVVLLALLASCRPHEPLPVLGAVPQFNLTAEDASSFSSASLAGKVWVADFIFTNCPGPCPRMTSQMHRIQTGTSQLANVALVSFTVDPKRDTPPVLTAYARKFQYQPGRWFFLTGPVSALQVLAKNTFHLCDISGDSNNIDHSTRFVLIDQQGRIRKYYGTSDGDPIPAIIDDVKQLAAEKI